jgi:hypothetical protein
MLSRRKFKLSSPGTRRLVTALALAAYALSLVGFPLPLPAGKDTSTPFPCQHHHCGCHSAEQCWSSCCCYSPEERLAWARRHGVRIPRETRLAMASGSCDRHAHADGESCCRDKAQTQDDHGCETCRREQSGRKVGLVFGFQAHKCRGLTTLWVAAGVTPPPAADSLWEFEWVEVGQVCPLDTTFSAPFSRVPVPPPRASA